jgi:hypothetical protein
MVEGKKNSNDGTQSQHGSGTSQKLPAPTKSSVYPRCMVFRNSSIDLDFGVIKKGFVVCCGLILSRAEVQAV